MDNVHVSGLTGSNVAVVQQALIIIANGVEATECVTIVDILRRAKINVILASSGGKEITCSNGIQLKADKDITSCIGHLFHAIIIPGGKKSADILARDVNVGNILSSNYNIGNKIGAICAGPLVLQKHKIGHGRRITSYPSFQLQLRIDYNFVEGKKVVRDGHVITAQGPAQATEFAFEIIEQVYGASGGAAIVQNVKDDICY